MMEYREGKIVKGRVTGIQPYGAFINLDDFYSGLIHISEISHGFVRNIEDFMKVGDTIYVKVLEIDGDLNQLKLSIKDINYRIKKVPYKRRTIKETPKGFKPLKEKLDLWMDNAIKEIENNNL